MRRGKREGEEEMTKTGERESEEVKEREGSGSQ